MEKTYNPYEPFTPYGEDVLYCDAMFEEELKVGDKCNVLCTHGRMAIRESAFFIVRKVIEDNAHLNNSFGDLAGYASRGSITYTKQEALRRAELRRSNKTIK